MLVRVQDECDATVTEMSETDLADDIAPQNRNDEAPGQADQDPGQADYTFGEDDTPPDGEDAPYDPERPGLRRFNEDLLRVYDVAEAQAEGIPSAGGTATGLTDLDYATGGLRPGHLYFLASHLGHGRTSLALAVAFNVAASGRDAHFFSPSMSRQEVARRVICAQAGLDGSRITAGVLSDDEWGQMAVTIETAFGAPFLIDSRSSLTSEYILAESLLRFTVETGLIVVDGLEMMTPQRHRGSRQEELADIAIALKRTARELGVPIIVTCGVSREALRRPTPRPQIWDLPGDGVLEEAADGIFLLYRYPPTPAHSAEASHALTLSVEPVDLVIAKNPNGILGMVRVGFVPAYRKFVNFQESTDEPSGF